VAKKIISYKLDENGNVPDYVDDGGYLPKDANTANMVLIGISKDGVDISTAETEFTNIADLVAYVKTYLSDATFNNYVGEQRTFIVEDAVKDLFAKLTQ
jgi:hypothetical protein